MQNKNPLTVFILLFLFFSCRSKNLDEKYYKYSNTLTDSIIAVNSQKVKHLKCNLYTVDDTLSIGVSYFEKEYSKNKDEIETVLKGKLMFNSIVYKLNIDTLSYSWLVEDLISKDKQKVFAFPRKYMIPSLKILKLNSSDVVVCDENYTYLKDTKFVYCIPTDSYLDVAPLKFTTIIKDGVTFGSDSIHYFYFDSLVENFDLKN